MTEEMETLLKIRDREFVTKRRFVKELSKVISLFKPDIKKLEYDIFVDDQEYLYEYLVITYSGGAIAVRNCRCNSLSEIFREVGRVLDGGYYDEVKDYKVLKSKSKPYIELSK